jgi:metalloendopeptidase OMA1, mitochondrial
VGASVKVRDQVAMKVATKSGLRMSKLECGAMRGESPLVEAIALWFSAGMRLEQACVGWVVALMLVMTGCTTVPETGRSQFNLLTPSEEMKLGITAFDQMKGETPISKDKAANQLVQNVGKRIAAVAELPDAQWEFVVFESEQANAFCLPGGKVGVYTGILPITKTEAGLATVIGHEVAHAVARHGGERVSTSVAVQAVGGVASELSNRLSDPQVKQAVVSAYGLGATVGVELPFSRKQESEADYIGLLYMARAGYDPEEAVKFWQRFAEYNEKAGGDTIWFLRTHPLDEDRIRQLQEWLPEAKAQFRPAN